MTAVPEQMMELMRRRARHEMRIVLIKEKIAELQREVVNEEMEVARLNEEFTSLTLKHHQPRHTEAKKETKHDMRFFDEKRHMLYRNVCKHKDKCVRVVMRDGSWFTKCDFAHPEQIGDQRKALDDPENADLGFRIRENRCNFGAQCHNKNWSFAKNPCILVHDDSQFIVEFFPQENK